VKPVDLNADRVVVPPVHDGSLVGVRWEEEDSSVCLEIIEDVVVHSDVRPKPRLEIRVPKVATFVGVGLRCPDIIFDIVLVTPRSLEEGRELFRQRSMLPISKEWESHLSEYPSLMVIDCSMGGGAVAFGSWEIGEVVWRTVERGS
jgi:hypothetical protein